MAQSSRKFGQFELDRARFELRRDGRVQKLERMPMELLLLLVEKDGHVVSRAEIIERLWGGSVFVDSEHGINTAIRKVRAALHKTLPLSQAREAHRMMANAEVVGKLALLPWAA